MTVTALQDIAEGVKLDLNEYVSDNLQYEGNEYIYPQLFHVNDPGDPGAYRAGSSLQFRGDYEEIAEGQSCANPGNSIDGYTWGAKNRKYQVEESLNPDVAKDSVKLNNFLGTLGETFVRNYQLYLEDQAAKVFTLGGLTAGNSWFLNTVTGIFTDASGNYCYDGKPFFAASGNGHPTKETVPQTFANNVAKSLSFTDLAAVKELFHTNQIDDAGKRVTLREDTLLVPRQLETSAQQIINAAAIPGSANNDANPFNKTVDIVTWDALNANASTWFYGKRQFGLEIDIVEPLKVHTFVNAKTEIIDVWANARVRFVIKNWRGWVGVNVPTS